MWRFSRNSGSRHVLQPWRSLQACHGIALPFRLKLTRYYLYFQQSDLLLLRAGNRKIEVRLLGKQWPFSLARQPSRLGTVPLILHTSVLFPGLRRPELEAGNLSPSGSGDKNSYLVPPLTSRTCQTDQKSVYTCWSVRIRSDTPSSVTKIGCCFLGPEVLGSEIATKLCGSANFV
jgi:hypothetical protein